ncbi:MAG: glutamyl-tRNA reductase [Gammaproteobacteria bacterium]|nr:glutamyl-tRNA reductase [Gammaproteobacteria bacterium]MDH5344672.1 glutamyl-tRNA reductase [Gammaproteobacteria bacterium]
MPLFILGLNHNTAPVEIREQVVFTGEDIDRALAVVTALEGIEEAVVLSTCNRTEFYVEGTDGGLGRLRSWLCDDQALDGPARDSLFSLNNEAAITHLFRVACGLDSMVLGEPQILGQLKDAFRHAELQSTVGSRLNRLFHHTFSVAKKVRTDTEIGTSPVSVAYAAVNLANQFFAGFSQHTALLIGAGVTIELVAKHLYSKEIGRLFVANRDLARAQKLASHFDGFALPLSELEGTLPEADILISSTASTEPVVTFAQMQMAVRARRHKPVFAVDIAVPRDLDPEIAKLDDVYLYTIDDLDKVIMEGQSNREAAAVDAERILEDETRRYLSIERSKEVAPIITALRDRGDSMREQVLEQARRRLAKGADPDEVLEYVTSALLKKLLHQPSVRLREAGEKSDREFVRTASELFGLGDGDGDGS